MTKLWDLINMVDSVLNIPRIGWIQRGVPSGIAESVGDHILLTSYLTIALCNELTSNGIDVNLGKCLVMALIHDIHESVMGNVGNNVRSLIPNWYDVEVQAFNALGLSGDLVELFKEYRYGKSVEGLLVQLADKIATFMRACTYLRRGYDVNELVINYKESVNKAFLTLPGNLREVLKGIIDELLSGCNNRTSP